MVIPFLLALALPLQEPDVRVELDRDEVQIGDLVQLSVLATGSDQDPVDIVDQPSFDGFTVAGVTRNSVVNYRGALGVRTTTWRYELRAAAPGSFMLGPIRVRIGTRELQSERVGIRVSATESARDEGLAQRLRRIVAFAPGPDGTDQVIVSVAASTDTLVVGDQLDLLVVAWFPRDVRTRLRTRPTMTPPELTGAWSYSQTAALGVLSSREVGGRMYDLFVHHQVVFPLTPGRFEVGAASVTYNLPLRTSILSREIPQEIQSRPRHVTVLPQPAAGQAGGAAARGLRLEVAVDTNRFASGEAATLVATLSGRGNVALWPEPSIDWPDGLRIYPGETEIHIEGDSGIVGGTKSYSYLLVADSVGTYNIPSPTFAYFDLELGRVRTAVAPAFRLVSRADRGGVTAAERSARVMQAVGPARAEQWFGLVPPWGWWVILAGPPVLTLLGRVPGRRRRRRRARVAPEPRDALTAINETFRAALGDLVPDAAVRDGDGLAAALTAAGVEAAVAQHAARVRDRLRQAVYGPNGGSDPDELAAEVREVLNALPRAHSARARVLRTAATTAVFALLLLPGGSVEGQRSGAEQLFNAGSFRQAADSFAARARAAPREPAHWVNLGYALDAVGEHARARVAWLKAARLQPRDRRVRSTLSSGPERGLSSGRLTRVFWVTPFEAWLAAGGLWILFWLLVGLRAPKGRLAVIAAVTLTTGAYGWYVADRYDRPVGLVVAATAEVRTAPHGSGAPARLLTEGTPVTIERNAGGWLFVRRPGVAGWILAEQVAGI